MTEHAPGPTQGQLIAQYLKLRATKLAMVAEQKLALQPYTAAMEAIENYCLQLMKEQGVTQLKDKEVGTAFQTTKTYVAIEDRDKIIEFARQADGGMDIFTNAISKDFVLSYVEAHDAPPPGVKITRETEVQFRKA